MSTFKTKLNVAEAHPNSRNPVREMVCATPASFDAWLEADLEKLEERFARFQTKRSLGRSLRRDR